MTHEFKLYIDRLKQGHTEKIREEVDPSFLDVTEKDLLFPVPVSVNGEAYLTDDHLVLRVKIKTKAKIPCTVCNEFFLYQIDTDFYHTEPLKEICNPIFDYSNILRESILLEIPPFMECHDGSCPERETINKYLKQETPCSNPGSDPNIQFPFSDL